VDIASGLEGAASVAGLVGIAFVVGVFRRRSGVRRAQALAANAFVFRFSMWGEFGKLLRQLPSSMLQAPRSGTSRVASVSAGSDGLVIWQVDAGARLATIPWFAVATLRGSATQADVLWRSVSFPTVRIDVVGPDCTAVTLPLLSANSRFIWPRTSTREVDRIVATLESLRNARATP
jgi:hypothetical protein